MSTDVYTGPERRKLPRDRTVPPDASVIDRLLTRIDTMRQVLRDDLDRPRHEAPTDGLRA